MSARKMSTLSIEEAGGALTVKLNRPEVRNAFHPTMIQELTQVFTDLATRADVAVVILKGEGKSFSSGADLGYMKSMAGFTLEENRKDANDLHAMFWALRSCPHVVVGRVHGHVMGGGLGLLALCDAAAAVDGTEFCFSEVKLGLAPAVISPFVLERMAHASARRFMLSGETFGVDDALDSGLVQFAGTATAVDQFVADFVQRIVSNGPEGMRATKALLRAMSGDSATWNARREMTTRTIAERRVSDEGQEGLKSFFEKRTPSWRSK